ncbi:MAG: hypothetical protein U5R06_10330 [candidate division KSB1 bacterium]|nr:hypothetical protein [candidate division KSB1 bacterium]
MKRLCVILCCLQTTVWAFGTRNGDVGLSYTRAAWTTPAGTFRVFPHMRFWGQAKEYIDPETRYSSGNMIWDVHGAMALTYGFTDHVSVSLTPVVYQDVHQGVREAVPWDTFLNFRAGSFSFSPQSHWSFGLDAGLRFPTGSKYNVIFEHYSAYAIEGGATACVSYAVDPLFPQESLHAHLNLGLWDYNEAGQVLVDNAAAVGAKAGENSQAFRLAAGVSYPTELFDYQLECYGNMFSMRPPAAAAGREDTWFLNATVVYKPKLWLQWISGIDIRLNHDRETTVGARQIPSPLPNTPGWRVHTGIRITVLPLSVYSTTPRQQLIQQAEEQRDLFERIISEEDDTEKMRKSLEQIQKERKEAEQSLEKVKEMLKKYRDKESSKQE